MRFIYLEPNIKNKKCLFKTDKKFRGENKNNIHIIIDYDKNFYSKNTIKLLDPITYEQFWVNHKDISLI
jgi:hypothetical protein